MTIQSVVKEVCSIVGVREPPGSIFVTSQADRTAWEMVQLANEMAQRIAFDTREWTVLRRPWEFTGEDLNPDPLVTDLRKSFPMPDNFQRMLKTSQVWRTTNTSAPMTFISDADDWLRRELQGYPITIGEWKFEGGDMHIRPPLGVTEKAKFYFLCNTPIVLSSGGLGTDFLHDDDKFLLPERLLKLGMIWQWKAYKGGTYAEDIANYEDALANIQGADKPAPIIVGSQTISSDANIAYWGPVPPPGTFVGPGP